MKRAALLACVVAAALLQGCERDPVRTVVKPPRPPTGFDVAQPAPQPVPAPVAPPVAAVPAPAASAPAAVGADAGGDSDGARLLAARDLMLPVVGVAADALRDHFTDARGGRVHEAIDIMAPAGRPVVAVDEGRIVKLFTSKPGGLTVYHFDPDGRLAYYYAHLQSYAPGLREGATVRRGELIGYVGSTGNADPAAPHLHFAVFRLGADKRWWEGEPVNPYPALAQADAAQVVAGR
ncbi:MAG: M23 family metallopeptidase [Comamonadaceae bacterium]|nr:MAG: M23 family metallopeptidase [Comamonadaceae bacterium]